MQTMRRVPQSALSLPLTLTVMAAACLTFPAHAQAIYTGASHSLQTTGKVHKHLQFVSETTTETVTTSATAGPTETISSSALILTTAAPTEAQAQAQFIQAHQNYEEGAFSNGIKTAPEHVGDDVSGSATVESTFTNPTQQLVAGNSKPSNLALDAVPIQIDADDKSIKEVVTAIVQQAATHTGSWTVKWRLKPENLSLLDDRVNLTAEAPFGEFVDLLTERIRNMSGITLFFKVFEQARVILITDTYY